MNITIYYKPFYYNIPYLFIHFNKKDNAKDKLKINNELSFDKSGFNISLNRSCFDYFTEANEFKEIIIIGSPIYNDKIDYVIIIIFT